MAEFEDLNSWLKNFTPRAKHVLALAQKESERLNHDYIGTEHLLLGLISLGEGVAVSVLKAMGLDLNTLRFEVERQFGTGGQTKQEGPAPMTARLKKIIAMSAGEARAMNYNYIGTEHLLLALLREGNSAAAQILRSLKVNVERVREEVVKALDPNYIPDESQQEDAASGQGAASAPNAAGPNASSEQMFPALSAFGRDLTEIARKGELDPVIGQDGHHRRPCRGDRLRFRPRTAPRQACVRPGSAPDDRGNQIPRTVRGAHQGRDRRSEKHQSRDSVH